MIFHFHSFVLIYNFLSSNYGFIFKGSERVTEWTNENVTAVLDDVFHYYFRTLSDKLLSSLSLIADCS